jgi:uncharacterized protein
MAKIIQRLNYINKINYLIENNPVVALIGSRQVGKTTLAREIARLFPETSFFDLENPAHFERLRDPMLTLQPLTGLIIIDEVQHHPDLFKVLRVLVDEPENKRKFLVLGSASPVLLHQTSESLAGRIAYMEIIGFSLQEVGKEHLKRLWLQGGFPRSYLSKDLTTSNQWRQNFIRTFLERDLPQLGINIPAVTMRRFWMMLAHYHGQIWNASEFGRAFGMSDKTLRNYLDILTSTFVIQQLSPWWENISKRQIKSPKIYLSDTGILHTLLGIENQEQLESYPKVGASWESFALNTVVDHLNIQPEEIFFWGTHTGAELDLLLMRGNTRLGFEFKHTSTPASTRSIQQALEDLNLTYVYIVYSGNETYKLGEKIIAVGITRIAEDIHF